MAKKSKIAKNEQRRVIVARYAERRAELKRIIKSPSTTPEARVAWLACQFGLSRVRVRELAHEGQLPGVRKSSW